MDRELKVAALIEDMSELLEENHRYVKKQKTLENILPKRDIDLNDYLIAVIPENISQPQNTSRVPIKNQYDLLRHKFRGQPELLALLLLTISYIRRKPKFMDEAIHLFYRIIDEHTEFVALNLNLRFIFSVLRTIAEYGRTERERLVGALSFNYASLIRCYESERSLDQLSAENSTFSLPVSGIPRDGTVMGNYKPGNDGAASIINTLLLREIVDDETPVGIFSLMMLAEMKSTHTIFSRVDKLLTANPQYHPNFIRFGFGRPRSIRENSSPKID